MNCGDLRDLYELYALGALEEDEDRAELRAHLRRNCPTCAAGVKRAGLFGADLGLLAPASQPSPQLRRRVLASVGAPQTDRRLLVFAFAAAALGLLAAVLLGVQSERQREASLQIESRLGAENARMREVVDWFALPETRQVVFGTGAQPANAPPGGRVLVNPARGVLVMASHLQALPADKIYELWLIPKGRAPLPAGLFHSSPTGPTLFVSSGPVDVGVLAAIAVSVEPAAGSSAPTTTPILVAAL